MRGDTVDVIPAYENNIVRVEIENGKIKSIKEINPITGDMIAKIDGNINISCKAVCRPAGKAARPHLKRLERNLQEQLPKLPALEAQRLEKKVKYDLEMISEMGYCNGIENYSRHFDGRAPGRAAVCADRLFPKGFPAHNRREPPDNPPVKGDV